MMAAYHVPPDDDPVAVWVAQLNYLAQLSDETFVRDQVTHAIRSQDLKRLHAAYRNLAAHRPDEHNTEEEVTNEED